MQNMRTVRSNKWQCARITELWDPSLNLGFSFRTQTPEFKMAKPTTKKGFHPMLFALALAKLEIGFIIHSLTCLRLDLVWKWKNFLNLKSLARWPNRLDTESENSTSFIKYPNSKKFVLCVRTFDCAFSTDQQSGKLFNQEKKTDLCRFLFG